MPTVFKKKRRGRVALIVAVILSLLLTCTAGALWVVAEPYSHATLDLTLMEIPRNNRPPLLLAYDSEARIARGGEPHAAAGCTVAIVGNDRFTPYEEIPENLVNAFVAIEDKRFWRHGGVDLLRTAHATLRYLLGNPTFGGSTITQQLIKNLTGEDDATPERKLTEIFRAWDLEERVGKTDILEAYLNVINLGNGCIGVGMAAEAYFSKSPTELTLAECATVAAITNNPSVYDPIRHPEANQRRRDLILRRMAEEGYITEAERAAAVSVPLILRPPEQRRSTTPVSWYADLVASDVIGDLMDTYGYTYAAASGLFYRGGLTVETVMDEALQQIVEEYYVDTAHFPVGRDGRPASAFILLDPATGDILAVAGAVGKKTGDRLQSYATDTRRPAGSCIKPLSVYAPALKQGLCTWSTLYEDTPVSEKDGRPWPSNADGLYRGRINVSEALAHSVNTVAVTMLEEVGTDYAFAFARQAMGAHSLLTPSEESHHDMTVSSLALGQQSRGVTLEELTGAYTIFFDGILRSPRSYHRVLDGEGRVLLEHPLSGEENRLLTPAQAALMTKLLQTVTEEGSAARYLSHLPAMGIQTAGKTGTTQNNCDRRFVGYTPNLLGGVWMGYDYPAELAGIQGNPCVGIWDEIMSLCTKAYGGAPVSSYFPVPDDLIQAEFCSLSGDAPGEYCTHPTGGIPTKAGWFILGTEPIRACTLHEEPPIPLRPTDPSDPQRIPLFPNDLLPETEVETEAHREPDREKDFGLRRWFSRFFGGEP